MWDHLFEHGAGQVKPAGTHNYRERSGNLDAIPPPGHYSSVLDAESGSAAITFVIIVLLLGTAIMALVMFQAILITMLLFTGLFWLSHSCGFWSHTPWSFGLCDPDNCAFPEDRWHSF